MIYNPTSQTTHVGRNHDEEYRDQTSLQIDEFYQKVLGYC
jgi:hypothetical protein